MLKTIKIGWTKSDMDNGYSSYDGWRSGAEQHTETIEVDVPDREHDGLTVEMSPEHIAEYVFEATNSPYPILLAASIFGAIQRTGYRGEQAHFSLSVGDTVTVDGVTLAVERTGFKTLEVVL